ncbi:hypothetical protein F511_06424 [Dorcoceras hygrometricum]|uniref:Uncharacterized protein n=1 Tax=Dorcoceras hygrometricum TaxID=472368 RepID=A0A2Z7B5B1_9LAMI|nr:hypothetical protein F511_06424 [Dorcoceras hygrometricum]
MRHRASIVGRTASTSGASMQRRRAAAGRPPSRRVAIIERPPRAVEVPDVQPRCATSAHVSRDQRRSTAQRVAHLCTTSQQQWRNLAANSRPAGAASARRGAAMRGGAVAFFEEFSFDFDLKFEIQI